MGKVNLKALSPEEMKVFLKGLGLPSYRAGQIIRWIYEKGAVSIEEMTDLSKDLRARLSGLSYISALVLMDEKTSRDGTRKFLFRLEDGEAIESVLIYDEDRLTLCISSQAGCRMGCRFCLTGKGGLRRNLRAFEMADQVMAASRLAGDRITNIVFMGMGEPLTNLDEVAEAIRRLTGLMHFPKGRITLSTAGLVPEILKLPSLAPLVNLAISLNATTDTVRDYLMPVNRKYPISALLNALRRFPLPKRGRITFEYVMIDGLNDTAADAKRLITLLKGIPSKVNLIPFNEFEGSGLRRPSDNKVLEFQGILIRGGMTAFIRKSKGSDIMAACGQLRGAVADPL
ncbi:MAG: 23S rRNA (adenine(2503)-C(2))-methyltransferase RlmN [Thermodesulfovibrionales bacterium]|nr:23S rRNA (adenine(2503)-C(2))-methyltransferase RlmN [Thermodesulfovibrionales bacterium]